MNYNPELHLRGRCVDEGALGMILFKISWLCSNCFFSSRWNCETRCANYAQNFGGTCHSNILEHTLLQLLGNVISAREWCNKNANTVLYVFYESKRTLTPPLNPPKARHSSGRPWESLWEVLELWVARRIKSKICVATFQHCECEAFNRCDPEITSTCIV